MKAAIVNLNNIVENVIVWDDTCIVPENFLAIPLDDNYYVSIGFVYTSNGTFINPNTISNTAS